MRVNAKRTFLSLRLVRLGFNKSFRCLGFIVYLIFGRSAMKSADIASCDSKSGSSNRRKIFSVLHEQPNDSLIRTSCRNRSPSQAKTMRRFNTYSEVEKPSGSCIVSRPHLPSCVNFSIASQYGDGDTKPNERLAWDALMLATDFQQILPSKHCPSHMIQSKHRKTTKPIELPVVIPPYNNRNSSTADSNAHSRISRFEQTLSSIASDDRLETGPRRRLILPKLLVTYTQQEMAAETQPLELPLCRRPSILRQGRFNTRNVRTISSVDSDLPSLASSSTSEEGDDQVETSPKTVTFLIFEDDHHKASRCIRFDPRVWVREFVRSKFECERIWFTPEEMDHFKTSAIQLVRDYNAAQSTELIPNCTGRIVQIPTTTTTTNTIQKALFSHQALSTLDCTNVEESQCHPSLVRRAVAEHEIRNVLVVDPHEICRTLFTKSFKKILPHVTVTSVASSEEALREISSICCDHAKRGFDIVLVEEVLRKYDPNDIDIPTKVTCSGSTLFRELSWKSMHMPCLHIGVTKDKDMYEERLYNCGADLVWSKPPPPANEGMRDQMLLALLMKRGKHDMIGKLF